MPPTASLLFAEGTLVIALDGLDDALVDKPFGAGLFDIGAVAGFFRTNS